MSAPTYLSLFSGAGGLDLGLDHAGWTCTGQAEIDPTCRNVLARHWPHVHRWDDVHAVHAVPDTHPGRDSGDVRGTADQRRPHGAIREQDAVDLVAGGFPCQDISVAGRRAGLAGERSGLWWEFHRIIHTVRPRAVLVENVEGLLSSNGGRDLGAIIDALVELGYGAAWRVLDAQHFGVPQRRRRVFLLALTGGHLGTQRAAQVLALTPGSAGDPATRPSTRPGTASSPALGVGLPRVASTLGTTRGGGHGLNAEKALAGRSASRLDDACAGGGQLVPTTVVNALDCKRGGPDDNDAQAGRGVPLVFHQTQDPITGTDVAPSAGATSLGMGVHTTGVRRLTPRECERLMGWPDDHTRWTHDGREIADSRRYAMCGNGVVAPVAQWIGQRLATELAKRQEVAA